MDHVVGIFRRHGIPTHDAQDLAQEVFLVMLRRWADYDPERPLRAWLAGIAFKVMSEHRRRNDRRRVELPDLEEQSSGADEHLASARVRTLAWKALASMPEDLRVLLVKHDLEGLPMREIASALRMPLFTGYSRLRRARQAFASAALSAAARDRERLMA